MTLLKSFAFSMFPPSSRKAFRSRSRVAFDLKLIVPRVLGLMINWLDAIWHHRQQWRPNGGEVCFSCVDYSVFDWLTTSSWQAKHSGQELIVATEKCLNLFPAIKSITGNLLFKLIMQCCKFRPLTSRCASPSLRSRQTGPQLPSGWSLCLELQKY